MWIGWLAPSLGQIVLLLLATGDYGPRCPFRGPQYLLDLLHECRQLPLEIITCQTFTSARVSIECHWSAYTGSHPAGNHHVPDSLMMEAMELAMFCNILSALGLYSKPFHCETS